MLKRTSFAVALLSMLAPGPCLRGRRSPEKFKQKMVILGFDGMDPRLVEKWMSEGKLRTSRSWPARAASIRWRQRDSPESPTAWASFATGVNAGKHNIYDFLVRDTGDVPARPRHGPTREPPRVSLQLRADRAAEGHVDARRHVVLGDGRPGGRAVERCSTVPVTFPPEDVPNGELLSGLPLPDIRGTMGTFYYFATDLSRYEEGNTEFGGILKRLAFDGDVAQTELVGPPNPIVRQQIRRSARRGRR